MMIFGLIRKKLLCFFQVRPEKENIIKAEKRCFCIRLLPFEL